MKRNKKLINIFNYSHLRENGEIIGNSNKFLILACGALSKEISTLIRINNWSHIETQYLPAILHNSPEKITAELRKILLNSQANYSKIFVGFADCGTGGKIDSLIEEFGLKRLPGADCYEFFSGSKLFEKIMEDEPGTFFLTDFLVRTFEKLVWRGLMIDKKPELLNIYFKHYKKVMYLAQTDNLILQRKAKNISELLKLEYEYRLVGYGQLENSLSSLGNKK